MANQHDEERDGFEEPVWLRGLGKALQPSSVGTLGPCPDALALAKGLEDPGDSAILAHLAACPACQTQRLLASQPEAAVEPPPNRLNAILRAAQSAAQSATQNSTQNSTQTASQNSTQTATQTASQSASQSALARKSSTAPPVSGRGWFATPSIRRGVGMGAGVMVALLALLFVLRPAPKANLEPWTEGSVSLDTGEFRSGENPETLEPLHLATDRPLVLHWQPGHRVEGGALPQVRAFAIGADAASPLIAEIPATVEPSGAALTVLLAPRRLDVETGAALRLVLALGEVSALDAQRVLVRARALPSTEARLVCESVSEGARVCLCPQPLLAPERGSAP